MVNNRIVTKCTSGYATGEKKPSFFFSQKIKNFIENEFIS